MLQTTVFPACVVTHAQSRKFGDVMNLADLLLFSADEPVKTDLPAGRGRGSC